MDKEWLKRIIGKQEQENISPYNIYKFQTCFGNTIGIQWGVKQDEFPQKNGDKLAIAGCKRKLKIGDYIIASYDEVKMIFKISEIEYKSNPSDLFFGTAILIGGLNKNEKDISDIPDDVVKYTEELKYGCATIAYA